MAQPQLSGPATEFTVLAAEGQSVGAAEQAVRDAGGTVVTANAAVGLITATALANGFTERIATNPALFGAAKNKPIGSAPKDQAAQAERGREGRAEFAEFRRIERKEGPEARRHGPVGRPALGSQVGAFRSFPDGSGR
jgi:hypothetical protein